MNLINNRWIPIRRSNGALELIAPSQITETDNPVIALDAPRPDFNGALMQFLIGLLQTAATPESPEKWLDWLEEPPTAEILKEHFNQYVGAFELQSDRGSFMQDFEAVEGKEWAIEKLVMESPGDNTVKLNKDHFFKRNQYEKMCSSCAATSLFSFQLNTQGFGASHRVSLRGKGPLTTLVVLDTDSASDLGDRLLWSNIWLNVLDSIWLERIPPGKKMESLADLFPWMGTTRISTSIKIKEGKKKIQKYVEGGVGTAPDSVDRLQVFWPMPCRVKLVISQDKCKCDLCNQEADVCTTGFQIKTFGVDYIGAWNHPLSPHHLDEQGVSKVMRVPSDGVQYQHWLGLIQKTNQQNPALAAERYFSLAEQYGEQFRLFSFGFDIDGENKARCWYETTFPLFNIPENIHLAFSKRTNAMVNTASEFVEFLRKRIKEAWLDSDPKKNRETKKKFSNSSVAQNISSSFYQHTENDFFLAVKDLQVKLVDGTDKEVLHEWHKTLCSASRDLFDYWTANGDLSQANPRRIAQARRDLISKDFYSKKIKEALQIPNQSKSNKEAA